MEPLRGLMRQLAALTGPGRRRARPGQILLPSLLVIPSLLIFVYLLFETTKISREKIRQQFAVDSAAFIQMGDYTNFLNRTAYVNGPFPYRIFRERYSCPPEVPFAFDDDSGQICQYNLFFNSGAYPIYVGDKDSSQPPPNMDDMPEWKIQFTNESNNQDNEQGDNNLRVKFITVPGTQEDIELLDMTTQLQGSFVKVPWPLVSQAYMFYAQVYSLLGSVEDSQLTVFERLTASFNFFRKSYYLNAGTKECQDSPGACGEDGAIRSPNGFNASSNKITRGNSGVLFHYVKKIGFHAKVYTGGWPSPYYLGKTNPPMEMTKDNPKGLFQLATVDEGVLNNLGRGLDVYQGWQAPSNYFGVNFNEIAACREVGRPCVHARVSSQCPKVGGKNNCVWPNPTPKYQTRLYP